MGMLQKAHHIKRSKDRLLDLFPDLADRERILDYVPGVHGESTPQLRILCKSCEKEALIGWRAGRPKVLVCASCRQSAANKATRAAGKYDHAIKAQREPLEVVQALFIERGVEPLFTDYKRAADNLPFRCSCGRIGQMSYLNLKYQDSRTSVPTIPRCNECRKEFRRQLGKRNSKYLVHVTGEGHPQWNSALTDEDRQAAQYGRGALFHSWSRAVLERDNFTCQISGKRGVSLVAHHLYSWSGYPERRFDFENGITLSKEIHIEFHHIHGRKQVTFLQFAAFYQLKTGHSCPFIDSYC
jgi:hypothetical protein